MRDPSGNCCPLKCPNPEKHRPTQASAVHSKAKPLGNLRSSRSEAALWLAVSTCNCQPKVHRAPISPAPQPISFAESKYTMTRVRKVGARHRLRNPGLIRFPCKYQANVMVPGFILCQKRISQPSSRSAARLRLAWPSRLRKVPGFLHGALGHQNQLRPVDRHRGPPQAERSNGPSRLRRSPGGKAGKKTRGALGVAGNWGPNCSLRSKKMVLPFGAQGWFNPLQLNLIETSRTEGMAGKRGRAGWLGPRRQ